MHFLLFLPFVCQTLLISADEYFFHIKRGLPKWERIGHPLDTLTVLACFLFVLLVPFEKEKILPYACMSLFSCLFVTKDEFVHKHHCPASEQWLHALLFLNHPILLTLTGLMWPILQGKSSLAFLDPFLSDPGVLWQFMVVQALFCTLFLLYQILYWNFIWKNPQKS